MARMRVTTTKYEIIQVASEYFLSRGYSVTSPKMIADELGISTGNITYYFPTKEHLLLEIVDLLYKFQWDLINKYAKVTVGNIFTFCFETVFVARACENDALARDFFTAVFQSEMCRNYLRKNHEERAKVIFANECAEWTDAQFTRAELMVKGLQYSSVVGTDADITFEDKISGTLEQILGIYKVDHDVSQAEIKRAISTSYSGNGETVVQQFFDYVANTHIQSLKNMLRGNRRKQKTHDTVELRLEGAL